VCVYEEVATCYQLVATRRPRAVPDVEFDEQFECEVRLSISCSVRKICASLVRKVAYEKCSLLL
jgi:hypothetical protein